MERTTYTMTNEFAYSREAVAFCIGLNGVANIADRIVGTGLFYAKLHAAFCHIDQPLGFAIERTNRVGCAGVANPTFVDNANIDTDDITILQHMFFAGNAVTDYIVNGSADSRREWWDGGETWSCGSCTITFIN